jgi:glycosyltransferase involved in cell wall biosynthesis
VPETSGWQVTGGDHFMCACVYPSGSTPGLEGQVLSAVNQNGSADDTPDGSADDIPDLQQSEYRLVNAELAVAPMVSVVIPVKNEARNLPAVLASLPPWISEVVLIDGQSVDDTVTVAKECYPDIKIIRQMGDGKGDALRVGFAACTSDIIVMMDGDGSTDGAEIIRFVAALLAGADYAKGSRFSNSGGSDDITLHRRLGNRVLCGLANLALGTRYTDLCYGYNAFWARHLPALRLNCIGFEAETMMNIRAARAGLRVQEIPSHERCRIHGASNLHVVVDGWRILKVIVAEGFAERARPELGAKSPRRRPSLRHRSP